MAKVFRKDFAHPASDAVSVTPNDSADLAIVSRALYVGGAGNVTVVMEDGEPGDTVVFSDVKSSTVLPIAVRRVMATGTTATAIVALW